ncbi:hypothetical protein KP509_28G044300 [Ceratopteris richardii]|uniref:Uncharacterized protein n=1 Tax=Ceratopteris richardii TaxID=49495 RepID=A0A8T2RDF5_CERRI|nr:hypothetical protein KP509_28G044300 [Ceratopteris richardii]
MFFLPESACPLHFSPSPSLQPYVSALQSSILILLFLQQHTEPCTHQQCLLHCLQQYTRQQCLLSACDAGHLFIKSMKEYAWLEHPQQLHGQGCSCPLPMTCTPQGERMMQGPRGGLECQVGLVATIFIFAIFCSYRRSPFVFDLVQVHRRPPWEATASGNLGDHQSTMGDFTTNFKQPWVANEENGQSTSVCSCARQPTLMCGTMAGQRLYDRGVQYLYDMGDQCSIGNMDDYQFLQDCLVQIPHGQPQSTFT